jgi:hypothetical protein
MVLARNLQGDRPELQATAGAAAEVAAAVLARDYPAISPEAAARFNALADEAPLSFMADATGAVRPEDADYLVIGVTDTSDFESLPWVHIRAKRAEGIWAAWLAGLIVSPYRDRLRRCQQCGAWFVDLTRNKSARRCTRACTITWWNKQRPKGGAR